MYYKDIIYNKAKLIDDIKLYSIYLCALFFLLFFVVYIGVWFLLKPLSKNYEAMDEFITNAGHELKTPLASIMSSIGIMKKTKQYDDQIVEEMISETQRG